MDHQRRAGFLHQLAIQDVLDDELLRILNEFLWADERPHGREGVMRLGDQPVRAAAAVTPAAAIGYVVLKRVAKDIVRCLLGGHAVGTPADDHSEFAFPVDLSPSWRNSYG